MRALFGGQVLARGAHERHDEVDVVRVVQSGECSGERVLVEITGFDHVRPEFGEVDPPELVDRAGRAGGHRDRGGSHAREPGGAQRGSEAPWPAEVAAKLIGHQSLESRQRSAQTRVVAWVGGEQHRFLDDQPTTGYQPVADTTQYGLSIRQVNQQGPGVCEVERALRHAGPVNHVMPAHS
jgi:hypothetical protein